MSLGCGAAAGQARLVSIYGYEPWGGEQPAFGAEVRQTGVSVPENSLHTGRLERSRQGRGRCPVCLTLTGTEIAGHSKYSTAQFLAQLCRVIRIHLHVVLRPRDVDVGQVLRPAEYNIPTRTFLQTLRNSSRRL